MGTDEFDDLEQDEDLEWAIPGWAVAWRFGRNRPDALVEHIDDLRNRDLCRWLLHDEQEAFWAGVAAGRLLGRAETDDA